MIRVASSRIALLPTRQHKWLLCCCCSNNYYSRLVNSLYCVIIISSTMIVFMMMMTTTLVVLVDANNSYHELSSSSLSNNQHYDIDQDPFTLSNDRFYHHNSMNNNNNVIVDPTVNTNHNQLIYDSLYPINNNDDSSLFTSLSMSSFYDISDTQRMIRRNTVEGLKLQFRSESLHKNSILHHRVQLSLDMTSSLSFLSNSITNSPLPLFSNVLSSTYFGDVSGTTTTTTTAAASNPSYHYTSTGTTIAGICGNDFIVIGADSRSTSGTMVADKTCYKLHILSSNVVAAGAGTAADIDHITNECYYTMKLIQKIQLEHSNYDIDNTNDIQQQPISVYKVCDYLSQRLYEEQGNCQANLIVGGVYKGKALLRAIHPHGSYDTVTYTALGSGGLAAMSILETAYDQHLLLNNNNNNNNRKRNNVKNDLSSINDNNHIDYDDKKKMTSKMSVSDAVELVVKAISAGIINDLGSGSQIDIVVINPNGITKLKRGVVKEETLPPISYQYNKNIDNNKDIDSQQIDDDDNAHDLNNNIIKRENTTTTTTTTTIVSGVNGFGNIPYIIKSRRIIKPSDYQQQLNIKKKWYNLLGLS